MQVAMISCFENPNKIPKIHINELYLWPNFLICKDVTTVVLSWQSIPRAFTLKHTNFGFIDIFHYFLSYKVYCKVSRGY